MRSGIDRLRMGAEMFDTAKSLVMRSLNETSERKLRLKIFLRFYGTEFNPEQRGKIAFTLGHINDELIYEKVGKNI